MFCFLHFFVPSIIGSEEDFIKLNSYTMFKFVLKMLRQGISCGLRNIVKAHFRFITWNSSTMSDKTVVITRPEQVLRIIAFIGCQAWTNNVLYLCRNHSCVFKRDLPSPTLCHHIYDMTSLERRKLLTVVYGPTFLHCDLKPKDEHPTMDLLRT